MNIKLLVDGGDMKPGPSVAQQLGPAGINIGKVLQQVNESTKNFKGMKVPVTLHVDTKTKSFTISIASPPVSELLKKEAGAEKGSGMHTKSKVGNLAIEQVISVAKIKHPNMLAREFISAVKSVIGSAISLGLLIENKEAKDILHEVEKGSFAEEIKEQISSVSPEKKKQIDAFFKDLKTKQEEALRKEEEAKTAAEEAAKAAQAAVPTPTAAAKPGEKTEDKKAAPGAKPDEKKPAEAKKPEAKKK